MGNCIRIGISTDVYTPEVAIPKDEVCISIDEVAINEIEMKEIKIEDSIMSLTSLEIQKIVNDVEELLEEEYQEELENFADEIIEYNKN